MKKIYFTLVSALLITVTFVQAQVSHGGQPLNWETAQVPSIESVRLPALDMASIEAEDALNDPYKELGFRFGIEHSVSLSTTNSGTWSLEDNLQVWRLGIHAPEAKGITMVFNEFSLPKSAQLFIYDAKKTHFIGSFDYRNKQANGMLATTIVYGEQVIVELQIPASVNREEVELSINQIVHAYRGFNAHLQAVKEELARGPFGNSDPCNIGVNCPEGDDWQVEKKSVALIASGGNAVCSGALVNNTENDGHPYFLTANHCLGGGVGNWTFYFNHEADQSNCNGSTGPINQTVSGATTLASNAASDFALLEINNGNAITYDVEWAGWDNSDAEASVTAATGIHHPAGDLKKISHDTDGPYHQVSGGAEVWYIDQWEEGVTQGGSSGSPLFNQDHRIIGQLYGGYAQCAGTVNNGEADWYGRFGVSWDGTSASTRLRDWLDPNSTGATTLDGYPTGQVEYALDATSGGFQNLPTELCTPETVSPVFVLKNNGTNNLTSCVITYSYNNNANQTINWTGNLAQNATEAVQLSDFVAELGTNTITVSVTLPNGQSDENPSNNTTARSFEVSDLGEGEIRVTVRTDYYGHETYWEILDPNNQVIASGGNEYVGSTGGGSQNANANNPGAYSGNTTYRDTVLLVGDGCYTFRILDDYSDGFCCNWGQGYYRIQDMNNTILAEGASFNKEELKNFAMIGGLGVENTDWGHVRIYPNPTQGVLSVDAPNVPDLHTISVIDMVGKVVAAITPSQSGIKQVDLSHLVDGVYFINLHANQGVYTQKVVLFND